MSVTTALASRGEKSIVRRFRAVHAERCRIDEKTGTFHDFRERSDRVGMNLRSEAIGKFLCTSNGSVDDMDLPESRDRAPPG